MKNKFAIFFCISTVFTTILGAALKEANNEVLVRTIIGDSVEDETVEAPDGRKSGRSYNSYPETYIFENESLRRMLSALAIHASERKDKSVVEWAKSTIDEYVKDTVDKVGIQAALAKPLPPTLRFDKDKIIMTCGGLTYVFKTLADSKLCFNGQMHDIRLI